MPFFLKTRKGFAWASPMGKGKKSGSGDGGSSLGKGKRKGFDVYDERTKEGV